MDLDQIEVIRLEKLEASFHGAQCAVAVSRINLGGEKDIFPALLGKLAKPLLAQPFQWPARVGTRGVEIVNAKGESALEQRLRGIFVLNGAEACAGAEADAGNHFSSSPQPAFRQRNCDRALTILPRQPAPPQPWWFSRTHDVTSATS